MDDKGPCAPRRPDALTCVVPLVRDNNTVDLPKVVCVFKAASLYTRLNVKRR